MPGSKDFYVDERSVKCISTMLQRVGGGCSSLLFQSYFRVTLAHSGILVRFSAESKGRAETPHSEFFLNAKYFPANIYVVNSKVVYGHHIWFFRTLGP